MTVLEPVLDPRGQQERPQLQLAPRVSIDELKQGPILFYNNTKLDYCNYDETFVRLKENFEKLGIHNFVDVRETVRGKSSQALKAYGADLVKRTAPKAAVVALGDMGTSPATTIVTIGTEEAGVPAVYITAPPGSDLVKSVAFYRAGHLCLCPIDIYQGSTREEVAREVDRQTQFILDSLTLPPDKIGACSMIDFALDKEPPAENGLIELGGKIATDNDRDSDPAGYVEEVNDLFTSLHLTDGLPIVPPTRRRYEQMLAYCPWDPDTVLAEEIGPSGKDITVKDVAVAAIMAGCKPTAMPILITAFKAMANERYNFLQSVTTSYAGGNLVLVSGPLAKEVGLYGGQGCLGPGAWANAAVGRAVNLVLINTCRSVPGVCDLSCISSQAEFTFCFAEEPELTPWSTINEERFDARTTSVLVLKAEPPRDIIDFLSTSAGDLMDTIVDSCTTLGSNNAYMPGALVLVLVPDHAEMLRRDGWDKDRIRQHIHERVHNETALVRNRGLSPARPAEFEDRHPMPVTRSPKDVEVVVGGGRGGHSASILPWALHSDAIVEPVLLPNGEVATTIESFRR
jgi:hypothetical protein